MIPAPISCLLLVPPSPYSKILSKDAANVSTLEGLANELSWPVDARRFVCLRALTSDGRPQLRPSITSFSYLGKSGKAGQGWARWKKVLMTGQRKDLLADPRKSLELRAQIPFDSVRGGIGVLTDKIRR
jgi:hypothetical protein